MLSTLFTLTSWTGQTPGSRVVALLHGLTSYRHVIMCENESRSFGLSDSMFLSPPFSFPANCPATIRINRSLSRERCNDYWCETASLLPQRYWIQFCVSPFWHLLLHVDPNDKRLTREHFFESPKLVIYLTVQVTERSLRISFPPNFACALSPTGRPAPPSTSSARVAAAAAANGRKINWRRILLFLCCCCWPVSQ
jgi:hypothetical protein